MRNGANAVAATAVAAVLGLASSAFAGAITLEDAPQAIGSLFLESAPGIGANIEAIPGSVTRAKVYKIITSKVAKTFDDLARQPESGVSFEKASGKLRISPEASAPGVSAPALEVNVYKVSRDLSNSLVVCLELRAGDYGVCTKAALLVARDVVKKEMTPAAKTRAK
jgi:hypothetical protein